METATDIQLDMNRIQVVRAIVKKISYVALSWSTINHEEIYLETEEGIVANWWNNDCVHVKYEEFVKVREGIKNKSLVPGKELNIAYNELGVIYFYL